MVQEGQARRLGTGLFRLLFIIAVLAFGTVGPLVRLIPLSSSQVALYRAAIALLVLALIMAKTGRFALLLAQYRLLWRLLLSGILMAANWILLFEAYRHTSIALATLTYYAAPSLVVIASFFLLKERLNRRQVFFFVMSTLGLVLLVGVSGGSPGDGRGIALSLFSAVLYASVVMTNKIAGHCDGILRTFTQFLGAVLVMLPYVALQEGFGLHQLDANSWFYLVLLGVFHTGICYSLYFLSLTRLSGQQAGILSYLDPLLAALLSVLVLGEPFSPLQILGALMMLSFAVLNEVFGQTKELDIMPSD